MARSKAARSPFEVKLSATQQEELADTLSREIEYAIQARDTVIGSQGSIERAYKKYEGGDRNITKDTPWKGAANLGSPIVTEKVDSMRARIVGTMFTSPIWMVEGFGASAERAPFVETYMQWKAEISGLQSRLSRVIHVALIEGTGILEVTDRVELRKGVRKARVLVQRDATTGTPMLGPDMNPIPVMKQNGKFQEAEPGEPHLSMVVSDVVRATTGPSYRVHSLRDFLVLPGHAAEKSDVWGYAKRFYRRLPELRNREKQGFYKNVEELGKHGDREATNDELRAGQEIAQQYDETAEKEIWEVNYLADLDGDGFEEWYVVTLSVNHRILLRCQYQDYNTPHYVLFPPYPRPQSLYGYSYAEDKLGSLYDEHSALRNMFADRSALATSAPFLVDASMVWDKNAHPFGPRSTIPVRDMNSIKQLEIKDVPNSIPAQIAAVLQMAERISGQNDTSTGVMASANRTLGEVDLTTKQSWIRIDEVIKNCQEPMEDLFNILLATYTAALEESPEEPPETLLQMMNERGISLPSGLITADMLYGTFRGKPKNSVEDADLTQMQGSLTQMLMMVGQLSATNPALAMHLQNPVVMKSILTQIARAYRWPDQQNLVANFTGMPPMPLPGLPGAPPQPGGPPGAPEAPGPAQPPPGPPAAVAGGGV